MKLKVIVHETEEGGYWAEVPSIPGCATQDWKTNKLNKRLPFSESQTGYSPGKIMCLTAGDKHSQNSSGLMKQSRFTSVSHSANAKAIF